MGFEKKKRIGELEMRTVSRSDAENPSDGGKAAGEVAMTGRNEQVSNYQTINGPGNA